MDSIVVFSCWDEPFSLLICNFLRLTYLDINWLDLFQLDLSWFELAALKDWFRSKLPGFGSSRLAYLDLQCQCLSVRKIHIQMHAHAYKSRIDGSPLGGASHVLMKPTIVFSCAHVSCIEIARVAENAYGSDPDRNSVSSRRRRPNTVWHHHHILNQ